MNSDSPNVQAIREAAIKHQEIDLSILEMLPAESRQIAKDGKVFILFLLVLLEAKEKELSDYRAALELYGRENGKDLLFQQNFALCLRHVRGV